MRRKAAPKRDLLPDPKYGSQVLTKFVNCVMESGKKSLSETIVYEALENAEQKLKGQSIEGLNQSGQGDMAVPLQILHHALDKVRPAVEVKSRRVGGATYQVPIEVRTKRGTSLAMRWLKDAARSRGEKTMALRLCGEIVDACQNRGTAVKKRDDVHRMAKANQAFAHYRW